MGKVLSINLKPFGISHDYQDWKANKSQKLHGLGRCLFVETISRLIRGIGEFL